MAPDEDKPRFVQVGALCYPEQAYFEALNVAGFAAVEHAFTAPSPRGVLRAVRGLRSPGAAAVVRRVAFAALAASGAGVDEAVLDGVVVARFPDT